jgi:hypothetical protein
LRSQEKRYQASDAHATAKVENKFCIVESNEIGSERSRSARQGHLSAGVDKKQDDNIALSCFKAT